ncbi:MULTISPECIES: phosphatase PAP2 family protein [unclassified Massilia]|uniref:phosphatase PAP2 family protein n=1 Tax=unclassified Massilia TaxID=2609279 RepID=UPI001785BB43|nr:MULTISPECIES: phosphatase PAP2 family protein [unclassified Massilia]MBD8530890.1 phosphatase PAP2 family protein [Massilia sp. CFBP 13647]MBD8674697.1 phosphatase PAP2 family protein [Massilia sp. CFBP 13721]
MRALVDTSPRLLGAGQLLRLCAWLAASAALIFWLGHFTDIDLDLADAVYDAGIHAFPWRYTWLADTFNHTILKGVLTLAAAWFVLAAARDAWRPRAGRTALDRLRLRVVGLSAVLVPVVISTLKQASVAHCPWDLARYGGSEPYLRLFEALPPGVAAGHCLPAGHASSALWLLSLCVLWLPARPRRACRVALAALLFGGLVGWMQQLRGAHFLTHTLWSIWLACAVVLAIVASVQWQPRRAETAPACAALEDAGGLR